MHYPDLSYTRSMVSSMAAGVTNYFIPIYSTHSNKYSAPAALLWFFDSKGGSKFQQEDPKGQTPDDRRIPIPSFVDSSVVEWFQQTNAELIQKHGHAIPSLAFVHIPIYAMAAFQRQGINPKLQPGINDDDPLSGQSFESNGYEAKDIPFMKALVDAGVKAVFSGHDHGAWTMVLADYQLTSLGDDWCFRWDSLLPNMTVAGNGMFGFFCLFFVYGW
jgi:hypothetical protein